MEETTNSQFDQFEKKEVKRRDLLPGWILVFCWLFMILGLAGIASLLGGLLGYNLSLSFYGFETYEPISFMGISIIAVILFKAFTAFSLWFEKDNAILLGKIDAISGIIFCMISMIVLPMLDENTGVTLRLELVLLIPYYYKLDNIKKTW